MNKLMREQLSLQQLEGIRLIRNMHRFNQEEKEHLLGVMQSYFAENPEACSRDFVDWFLHKQNIL